MEKIIKQVKQEDKKNLFDNKKSILIGVGVIVLLIILLKLLTGGKTSVQVQTGIKPQEVEKSVEEVVKPIYKQQKEIQEQQKELLNSIAELNKTIKALNESLSKKETKKPERKEKVDLGGIIPKEIISGEEAVPKEQLEEEPKLQHIANYREEKKRFSITQNIQQEKREVKKKKKTVYIPAGSVVEGRLLYGFVAPAKGMLPPVLVEFTRPIRTANDFYIPAQKCLITTSAQYDISQGLAILGGLRSTLSCVLKNGKVIEIPVNIAVGEEEKDGFVQIGLTGKEKWLTAEDFAKISSMGTVTGISSGMQEGLVQQVVTPQGNVVTAIKDRGLYAVLSGVNQGTSKFFEFWMKKYEKKVPAIIVKPKKVFVVFVKGADLGVSDKELVL